MTREIPIAFSHEAEAIFLTSSILASKIRMKEFKGHESIFSCPYTMVRAYKKLFPAFEVVDGVVSRFGSVQGGPSQGEKGYFHYHESRSRQSIEGRFKLIRHSWLLFKEPQQPDIPQLVVDILSCGAVPGWSVAVPLCLDEFAPSFTKTRLPIDKKEEDFSKQVHLAVTYLQDIKMEVDALV